MGKTFGDKEHNFWVEERATKDFIKLLQYSKKEDLAIISIDMQKSFLKKVSIKDKRNILTVYHKKIKNLSIKNKVPFFEVSFKRAGKNVLTDKFSKYKIVKTTDSVHESTDLLEILSQELKIKNIYIIGINRGACILSSISDLSPFFKTYTSFLGTGDSKDLLDLQKRKLKVSDLNPNNYREIYEENGIEKISLIQDIKLLEKLDVTILDHYKK